MADDELEPQAPEKKEEKKPTGLENAVNESWNAIKGAANALAGKGAIAGATALFGLDGLVTAASFPIGAKISHGLAGKEFKSKNFRNEAIAGALFTPPLWYGIEAVKKVPAALGLESAVANILGASMPISPFVVGGLTAGVLTPALTLLYYPLQYAIKNKTFKGAGKDLKENYLPGLKRAIPITLFSSSAVGLSYAAPVFAPYLFPVLALSSVVYRMLLSKEGKIEYKRLLYPSTYLPNFINPFYLASGAGSLLGRGYSTVYRFGSAIADLFKRAPAPPKPASAPAAAPAPQPA